MCGTRARTERGSSCTSRRRTPASPGDLRRLVVADLDRTIDELASRGVRFEQYDQPGLKTNKRGVFDSGRFRAVWVKDPDGNTMRLRGLDLVNKSPRQALDVLIGARAYADPMKLFKRRGARIPDWSPFSSGEQWEAFADVVRSDASRRGWTALPEEAVVLAGDTSYGLNNLAQACRTQDGAAWPATVRGYFDKLVALPIDAQFGSAAEARAVLKARLVDDSFLARVPRSRRLAVSPRISNSSLPTTCRRRC